MEKAVTALFPRLNQNLSPREKAPPVNHCSEEERKLGNIVLWPFAGMR